MVAYNEDTVVLKKKYNDLVSVKIVQPSTGDREYLKSKEGAQQSDDDAEKPHTWTLRNGLKVNARVVGYGRRDIVVQRKRGKVYAGQPRKSTCEEVLVELENGDEHGVPFFFFSEQDLQVLRPGWERWLAADQDIQKMWETPLTKRAGG